MNLLKELKKSSSKKRKVIEKQISGDAIVEQAEQLLLNAHQDDMRTLEHLGLDHALEYHKKHETDYNRTKLAEKHYDRTVFTGAEIKALCNLYDLKMLHASHYNGTLPSDLTRKLNEFRDDHDVNIIDRSNFFIMAPVEQFKTIKDVPVSQDPILFYRTEVATKTYDREATEGDVFVPVHNWGNDFSPLRLGRRFFHTYSAHQGLPRLFQTMTSTIVFLFLFITSIAVGNMMFVAIISLIYGLLLARMFDNYHYDDLWNENLV